MFRKLFLFCLCLSVVLVQSVEHENVLATANDGISSSEITKESLIEQSKDKKTTIITTNVTTTTTTTTTAATTTTTTQKPAPKTPDFPAQTNPKKAEKGAWIVRDHKNITQLIIETQAVLSFEYLANGTAKRHSVDLNLPTNATVELNDKNDTKHVSLKWSLETNTTNSLTFVFSLNKTSNVYKMSAVSASIYLTEKYFVNYTASNKSIEIKSNGSVFDDTPVNSSYVCISDVSPVLIPSKEPNLNYTITLSFTHFEAFTNGNISSFSLAIECDMDGNALLPLIAAVILIILIFTVLVFYLLNRRRPQADGYTSM